MTQILLTIGIAITGAFAGWLKCVETNQKGTRITLHGWLLLFLIVFLTAVTSISSNKESEKNDTDIRNLSNQLTVSNSTIDELKVIVNVLRGQLDERKEIDKWKNNADASKERVMEHVNNLINYLKYADSDDKKQISLNKKHMDGVTLLFMENVSYSNHLNNTVKRVASLADDYLYFLGSDISSSLRKEQHERILSRIDNLRNEIQNEMNSSIAKELQAKTSVVE